MTTEMQTYDGQLVGEADMPLLVSLRLECEGMQRTTLDWHEVGCSLRLPDDAQVALVLRKKLTLFDNFEYKGRYRELDNKLIVLFGSNAPDDEAEVVITGCVLRAGDTVRLRGRAKEHTFGEPEDYREAARRTPKKIEVTEFLRVAEPAKAPPKKRSTMSRDRVVTLTFSLLGAVGLSLSLVFDRMLGLSYRNTLFVLFLFSLHLLALGAARLSNSLLFAPITGHANGELPQNTLFAWQLLGLDFILLLVFLTMEMPIIFAVPWTLRTNLVWGVLFLMAISLLAVFWVERPFRVFAWRLLRAARDSGSMTFLEAQLQDPSSLQRSVQITRHSEWYASADGGSKYRSWYNTTVGLVPSVETLHLIHNDKVYTLTPPRATFAFAERRFPRGFLWGQNLEESSSAEGTVCVLGRIEQGKIFRAAGVAPLLVFFGSLSQLRRIWLRSFLFPVVSLLVMAALLWPLSYFNVFALRLQGEAAVTMSSMEGVETEARCAATIAVFDVAGSNRCKLWLSCGEQLLYGGPGAGEFSCTISEDNLLESLSGNDSSAEDGDPALSLKPVSNMGEDERAVMPQNITHQIWWHNKEDKNIFLNISLQRSNWR